MELKENPSGAGLTFEKVWLAIQENDRKFEKWRREAEEQREEERKASEELREKERKASEKLREKERKEDAKRILDLEKLFTTQWGKLMETLVEGDLINILKDKGFDVSETATRQKGRRKDGGTFEFDIIAFNGNDVVIVEVKTTLRLDDVKEFIYKLNHIKEWSPRYTENRIIGAMAWLTAESNAETMAEKRGFYNIRATGNSAFITNADNFQPKIW